MQRQHVKWLLTLMLACACVVVELARKHMEAQVQLSVKARREIDNQVAANQLVLPAHKASSTASVPCTGNTGGQIKLEYPYVCQGSIVFVVTFLGAGEFPQNFVDIAPYAVAIILISRQGQELFPMPTNLSQLKLPLWFAAQSVFSGQFPADIGELQTLVYLYITEGQFEGGLPTELGKLVRLQQLELQKNQLSGTVPSQLGKLTGLLYMNLEINQFEGSIPTQFGQLLQLTDLRMGTNALTGEIPTQLAKLTLLQILDVKENQLSGTIPQQFTRLTLLQVLVLGENAFHDNIQFIASMPLLRTLILSKNEFFGTIPTEIGLATRLTDLRVHTNSLTGTLPSQLGLLPLSRLIVNDNSLSGTIPEALASKSFSNLDISNNKFSGRLSSTWEPIALCQGSGLSDTKCQTPRTDFLPLWLFICMCSVAAILAAILVALAVFIVRFRTHAALKTSGPVFSLLGLVGLLLLLCVVPSIGVAMLDYNVGQRKNACEAATALASVSLVVVLCSISVRNYPIWRIFNNPQMKRIVLTPQYLLRAVAVAVVVDAALMIPLLRFVGASYEEPWCYASNVPLLIVNGVYIFAHGVVAVAISLNIRSVPCLYNETKQVGKATYNVAGFGLVALTLAVVATSNTARFVALGMTILLMVLLFIVFVYLPKVRSVLFKDEAPRQARVQTIKPHTRSPPRMFLTADPAAFQQHRGSALTTAEKSSSASRR